MRLLGDTLRKPLPLLVVVLAGLIDQDKIDTAQSRWRGPHHLAVWTRPLLAQDCVNGINLDVLDTIHFG